LPRAAELAQSPHRSADSLRGSPRHLRRQLLSATASPPRSRGAPRPGPRPRRRRRGEAGKGGARAHPRAEGAWRGRAHRSRSARAGGCAQGARAAAQPAAPPAPPAPSARPSTSAPERLWAAWAGGPASCIRTRVPHPTVPVSGGRGRRGSGRPPKGRVYGPKRTSGTQVLEGEPLPRGPV
jgi:hypothetical protein